MSTPGSVEERARSLMKQDRWLDAVKLLRERSSRAGKHWKLSWNLGWCCYRLDRFDEAQEHLTRANKLAPDSPICKWALGCVYLEKEQYRKAEKVLAESLHIKESHYTRIALALAYLAQGKIEEAEMMHLENIKLKPRRSEGYESYAAFLSDVGREAESSKMMQKARMLRSVN